MKNRTLIVVAVAASVLLMLLLVVFNGKIASTPTPMSPAELDPAAHIGSAPIIPQVNPTLDGSFLGTNGSTWNWTFPAANGFALPDAGVGGVWYENRDGGVSGLPLGTPGQVLLASDSGAPVYVSTTISTSPNSGGGFAVDIATVVVTTLGGCNAVHGVNETAGTTFLPVGTATVKGVRFYWAGNVDAGTLTIDVDLWSSLSTSTARESGSGTVSAPGYYEIDFASPYTVTSPANPLSANGYFAVSAWETTGVWTTRCNAVPGAGNAYGQNDMLPAAPYFITPAILFGIYYTAAPSQALWQPYGQESAGSGHAYPGSAVAGSYTFPVGPVFQ
jgi:hypothetical protein